MLHRGAHRPATQTNVLTAPATQKKKNAYVLQLRQTKTITTFCRQQNLRTTTIAAAQVKIAQTMEQMTKIKNLSTDEIPVKIAARRPTATLRPAARASPRQQHRQQAPRKKMTKVDQQLLLRLSYVKWPTLQPAGSHQLVPVEVDIKRPRQKAKSIS